MDEMGYALGVSPEWDELRKDNGLEWLDLICLFALFSHGCKNLDEICELAEKITSGNESAAKLMLEDIKKRLDKK